MTVLAQYRQILSLMEIRKRAAEKALADVIGRQRALEEKAGRHRSAALADFAEDDSPSAGALRAASDAAAARRAEAARLDSQIRELLPDVVEKEKALGEIIRKVTAIEDIIEKLALEAAREAEERDDDETLRVTQNR